MRGQSRPQCHRGSSRSPSPSSSGSRSHVCVRERRERGEVLGRPAYGGGSEIQRDPARARGVFEAPTQHLLLGDQPRGVQDDLGVALVALSLGTGVADVAEGAVKAASRTWLGSRMASPPLKLTAQGYPSSQHHTGPCSGPWMVQWPFRWAPSDCRGGSRSPNLWAGSYKAGGLCAEVRGSRPDSTRNGTRGGCRCC